MDIPVLNVMSSWYSYLIKRSLNVRIIKRQSIFYLNLSKVFLNYVKCLPTNCGYILTEHFKLNLTLILVKV